MDLTVIRVLCLDGIFIVEYKARAQLFPTGHRPPDKDPVMCFETIHFMMSVSSE